MSESNAPGAQSGGHMSVAPSESEQNRQRAKRSGSRRNGRPQESTDQQRQGRSRIDRAMVGFGDGVERATCQGVMSVPPRLFPVQHRTGLAVIPFTVVDRSPAAMLLCDEQHDGPHIWPNGDIVGDSGLEMPVIYVERAGQSH